MDIAPFALEQFFARYEFTTPHILCASDCESMSVAELLTLAGESLSNLGQIQLSYTESQGNPALRAAVAATYSQVDPDKVVILNSPEEGIYLTMRTLLQPGDELIVLTPAYASLRNVAEHICGKERVKQWSLRPSPTGWQLDLDELAALLTPRTKLLIVNFPHNPTGYLPHPDEFAAIVSLAQQHGCWLFCDEMYRGLELDGQLTLPAAVDLYARAIVLAGLSKVHGLPGLRAGWVVIHDSQVREAFINWKHYTSICPPAPGEFLALAGLRAQTELVNRNRAIIQNNLSLADDFFARWPDLFTWRRPLAGSVALAGIATESATAYCHQLAADAGVLLLPGAYLGYADQFVRFGLGRRSFAANLSHYEAHLLRQR
jgi:aspartate/methionine/tyrosine aminotransferase